MYQISKRLAPGMYPEDSWPVRNKQQPSLLIPPSSIVTTTERVFVIRLRDDKAEWVNVSLGSPVEDLVQVYGLLNPGGQIVRRGSDEIRKGNAVKAGAAK